MTTSFILPSCIHGHLHSRACSPKWIEQTGAFSLHGWRVCMRVRTLAFSSPFFVLLFDERGIEDRRKPTTTTTTRTAGLKTFYLDVPCTHQRGKRKRREECQTGDRPCASTNLVNDAISLVLSWRARLWNSSELREEREEEKERIVQTRSISLLLQATLSKTYYNEKPWQTALVSNGSVWNSSPSKEVNRSTKLQNREIAEENWLTGRSAGSERERERKRKRRASNLFLFFLHCVLHHHHHDENEGKETCVWNERIFDAAAVERARAKGNRCDVMKAVVQQR